MIAFLKNLVFHDFWLKLFSLALAILIWKIVSPAAYPDTDRPPASISPEPIWTFSSIPVFINAPATRVADIKISPSEVEVTVRGELEKLDNLQMNEIRAEVDLRGIEVTGSLSRRVEVVTPPGITFVKAKPEQVNVIVPPRPRTASGSITNEQRE